VVLIVSAVPGLPGTVYRKDFCSERPEMGALPAVPSHGSERMDRQNVSASIFHGSEDYVWSETLAL
jgi:hypothetical protein